MRTTLFISLLVLALGCGTKNPSAQLNGTWIPIKQEMGGMAMPDSMFQKESLVMNDSNYTFTAESVDKGVVRYSGDNKMDVYGKDGVNAGKHFTAIYKIENDELTICYNLAGDTPPESFDTKNKQMYFLSVYKKK